jgi:hypothetical protein
MRFVEIMLELLNKLIPKRGVPKAPPRVDVVEPPWVNHSRFQCNHPARVNGICVTCKRPA